MSYPDDGISPPTDSKATLRSWVRARRRELGDPPTNAHGEGLADAVLGTSVVRDELSARPDAPVLIYVDSQGEPPTAALRAQLRQAGRNVFVPWALPDRQMLWLRDDGSARAWGLPGVGGPQEPATAIETAALLAQQPSVVILPALAATPSGARMGQGGGYYDTLLADCTPWTDGGPLRVALVWPWEMVDQLPVDQHDQPVDIVVSYWPA